MAGNAETRRQALHKGRLAHTKGAMQRQHGVLRHERCDAGGDGARLLRRAGGDPGAEFGEEALFVVAHGSQSAAQVFEAAEGVKTQGSLREVPLLAEEPDQ